MCVWERGGLVGRSVRWVVSRSGGKVADAWLLVVTGTGWKEEEGEEEERDGERRMGRRNNLFKLSPGGGGGGRHSVSTNQLRPWVPVLPQLKPN